MFIKKKKKENLQNTLPRKKINNEITNYINRLGSQPKKDKHFSLFFNFNDYSGNERNTLTDWLVLHSGI